MLFSRFFCFQCRERIEALAGDMNNNPCNIGLPNDGFHTSMFCEGLLKKKDIPVCNDGDKSILQREISMLGEAKEILRYQVAGF